METIVMQLFVNLSRWHCKKILSWLMKSLFSQIDLMRFYDSGELQSIAFLLAMVTLKMYPPGEEQSSSVEKLASAGT